jgi:hypothetical protein
MKTTLCISTHCVKTETGGLYKGISNHVPSAPSTRMIEHVIDSFLENSLISKENIKIHVGFDKRSGREIDEEYERNLNKLSSVYNNFKLLVNESTIDDPIITAPSNFINLISSVDTNTYIFWEHDWVLNRQVDLNKLVGLVESEKVINYVRLNQFSNNNDRYNNLRQEELFIDNLSLIPTFRWSNNPYVCKTKIFKDWWSTFIYPTSNEGGFVEGPLNELFTFYIERMGFELANERFGCYVFGRWGEDAIVSHLNGNSWF